MIPRAGRFRLFDSAGINRLRCRLCGTVVKRDGQWRHLNTERDRATRWLLDHGAEDLMSLLLRLKKSESRSRRNLRRARWEYAVGRGRGRHAARAGRPGGQT